MIINKVQVIAGSRHAGYPFDTPVMRCLAEHPLELSRPVTVLIGENGEGKSTILLGIADAYGFDLGGGHGARRYSPPTPAHEWLSLHDGPARLRRSTANAHGYFHRGDRSHDLLSFMAAHGVKGYENADRLSSGQAFRHVTRHGRLSGTGLFLLDEPEVSLSASGQCEVIEAIKRIENAGGQVIMATHSPLFATYPDAEVLEIRDGKIQPTTWTESHIGQAWMNALGRAT